MKIKEGSIWIKTKNTPPNSGDIELIEVGSSSWLGE